MCRLMRMIWVLWLAAAGTISAVEVTEGPSVTVSGTTATVRWKLDTPAGGSVKYGRNPDALAGTAKSATVATEHMVSLEGLEPGARYHFSVGTARKPLQGGQFTVPMQPGVKKVPAASPGGADAPPRGSAGGDRRSEKHSSPPAAPATRLTWANVDTLRDHYERHGRDFGATSPDDYAAQAWHFLQRAKTERLPAKLDPEGTLRVWDPRTRAFAAYTRSGLTKTFFKPGSADYFDRQPGRPVRLKPDPAPGSP